MTVSDYGSWEPLPILKATALFAGAPFRWWVSGGHALELHLGHSWRDHADTDVSIVRDDAPLLLSVLEGWDVHVAAAGVLTPWDGSKLIASQSHNNLWCRADPTSPWRLDVTISDGDDAEWIYRRAPTIRRPWIQAVLTTEDGLPYLSPVLQLLFKSKNPRPKDHVDADVVISTLSTAERNELSGLLPDDHMWQALLDKSQPL